MPTTITAQYKNSNTASVISGVLTLAVVVGAPYLLHQQFNVYGLSGGWLGLVIIGTIVFVIATGGVLFGAVKPFLERLSKKGAQTLSFDGTMLTSGWSDAAVDLRRPHIGTITSTPRSTSISLQGETLKDAFMLTLPSYTRKQVLEHFRDESFLKPHGGADDAAATLMASTGSQSEGFTLDPKQELHRSFFSQLLQALEAQKAHNEAYQIHNQLPWDHTPQPDTHTAQRLDLKNPADKHIYDEQTANARLRIAPIAYVGTDYLVACHITAADTFKDIATGATRDPSTIGTYYVMPLGQIQSKLAVRTSAGSGSNASQQSTVYEISGPDAEGKTVHVDIPAPFSSKAIDTDALKKQALHDFITAKRMRSVT